MHPKTEINSSNAFGLLVDESTDVTITKKLAQKLSAKCRTKTCFLANTDIPDRRAVTIYDAIISWANVNLDKCVGFGSNSASVMLGSKSGVATHLKAMHVLVHCAAHRLALTSYQASKDTTYLTNFMEMFQAVYNYFHNSAVRSAKYK